jgi:hypothetical protein
VRQGTEFDEWASRPFRPNPAGLPDGKGSDVSLRVADALEYIAAQLGEICRKLDHVGLGQAADAEDFEQMKDLLRRL